MEFVGAAVKRSHAVGVNPSTLGSKFAPLEKLMHKNGTRNTSKVRTDSLLTLI